MTVDYRVGDVRKQMAEIPDGSISLVATSPPFAALRSYLPADHPDKHLEIGNESNPAAFVDTLLALTAEWGRVLAPWGSIAVELGDTYSGSGGAGGDYNADGLRAGEPKFKGSASRNRPRDTRPGRIGTSTADTPRPESPGGPGWPAAKSLALIPQAYALSLAYGYNVLRRPMSAEQVLWWIDGLRATGVSAEAALAMVGGWVATHPVESPAGRWLVRNVVVWHRPNPAVGALGDKFRPSTSYITVATRSPKRWFDLDSVRGPLSDRKADTSDPRLEPNKQRDGTNFNTLGPYTPTAGAPPLDTWTDHHDTWTITTQPSRLAHYAMWPPKLAERLILSMCPLEVCSICGQPRKRMTRTTQVDTGRTTNGAKRIGRGATSPDLSVRTLASVETLGWSDCGHGGQWTPGITLDPFAGTGTTLAAAEFHGRDAIGIDIDARNRSLYRRRCTEVFRKLTPSGETSGQLDLMTGMTS